MYEEKHQMRQSYIGKIPEYNIFLTISTLYTMSLTYCGSNLCAARKFCTNQNPWKKPFPELLHLRRFERFSNVT